MNINRRNFLKDAVIGAVAIPSLGRTSGLNQIIDIDNVDDGFVEESLLLIEGVEAQGIESQISEWEISFEETSSVLLIRNSSFTIEGQLNFTSGKNKWNVANSRDGILDRCVLVDSEGNVQGYVVFNQNCEQLQLLFYHRTAQSYKGMLSFEGKITFHTDSFPCRTRAKLDERVLSMSFGLTDSSLNDSLFSPENDTALLFDAANLRLETLGAGVYSFAMSGQIHESSQAIFTINLEKNYFRKRYVPYYHAIDRKRCPKTPTGWMSWNTYFDTATADDNLAEARIGQKYLRPFGCEFWEIESWQENSDKLPVRNFYNMNLETSKRKFPEGMKKLADDIRNLGFRPGLWMAPFGTGNEEFYKKHKNWFLHDKNGDPISSWNGRYTLDPTVPEAREHLKGIFKIASREWGYEYFKIDGMSGRNHGYCAHLYERPEIKAQFQDPSCPNPFELCIKTFREGIGEDRIILACQGHTTGPEILYVDACRIGADIVSPNKPVQWDGVVSQGRCFMNQAFTHNIVTIADPDTLLVGDLPLEEARVSATIVALPGQLTFFGDKLADLSDERMKLLQQTLPAVYVRPVSLYPFFSMLPIWNLAVHNSMLGDYNVVALFNWDDEPKKISFTCEELGIDSESNYVLFEFWAQRDLGVMKNNFTMDVPAHSVRLVSMHREKAIPQWISSDRHITQNAMELKEYNWIDDIRALSGKIELIGTFPVTMYLRIPPGYSFKTVECKGVKSSVINKTKSILGVKFIAKKTGIYPFKIKF